MYYILQFLVCPIPIPKEHLTLLDAGGGGIRPPYHINVVPRKMLKEKVANFL